MSTTIDTVQAPDRTATYDNRQAFADTLVELARTDERIVAVCNDSVSSSNLKAFAAEFPDRLVNVGIAEQNMVGVGAGLANAGLVPFVCSASPFLTGRSLEQVKADVAYSQHPVVLCGMSPGMSYGELGPTHHSIEDLSWLRALPGLDIVFPADRQQTAETVRLAVELRRPLFLRVGRYKVPDVTPAGATLERGKVQVVRDGSDVALVATGTLVSVALDAADLLAAEGVSARVVNAAWLAPFDEATILAAAAETRAVVTAEEANPSGGLGAAVTGLLAQSGPSVRRPVRVLGVPTFAPTGSNAFLLEHFGLTAAGLAQAARDALAEG
ncbi:transketolase C-terminal domain-containing protein [Nocardioides sp. GY 10127]|uniref:transketolase family protein n=1 Tax=Nocardioides sp. GY 10127 TaxID=2569762 RepID=UPI0010A8C733|nr:transketolase C-terminal domain-containing protein [Nocardioides sp. GY 10127]TIC84506.1 transketolase family protein [Nocardioides sp. GY 10127]